MFACSKLTCAELPYGETRVARTREWHLANPREHRGPWSNSAHGLGSCQYRKGAWLHIPPQVSLEVPKVPGDTCATAVSQTQLRRTSFPTRGNQSMLSHVPKAWWDLLHIGIGDAHRERHLHDMHLKNRRWLWEEAAGRGWQYLEV